VNRRDVLLGAAAVAACAPEANGQAQAPGFPIRRGVNIGSLEAPNEGEWGYRIQADHLSAIADAGFDGVRLPVRWDEHAEGNPGYRIDPGFMGRVEEVVGQALERGLKVQLDIHHFWRLIDEPGRYTPRVAQLWRQIAERFRGAPSGLIFEVLNELNGGYWTAARTTALYRDAIAAIRQSDRDRLIVVGPPDWNSINGLAGWTPPRDRNLALTVHYYHPYELTHGNAEWLDDPPRPRSWGGDSDLAELHRHIAEAATAAETHGLPLQLGEFGVNRAVPLAQRALWTRAVREACEAHQIGWCVWDFATTFQIFNQERGAFIPEMRAALLD